ncbi:uncharacterized protein LOC141772310 [Sebastes fasciatus]|uniref:uncharacterized protein LOC141772310 n=1 Tax=Sebastes fasciatus TaxID=394691 RepID=UPI003D9E2E97
MLSTLAVLGYIAALMAPAMCCLSDEYVTRDRECCSLCLEGSVVRRDCTQQSGTRCINCVNGTYMNKPNGLRNCFLCTSCDQGCVVTGHGLFAKQECTTTTDTICDVLSGYFCKDWMDDAGCSLAKKHTPCPPGHRVKVPGTSRTDTMCELCQPGHFSQDGWNCTAWTSCSETRVKVKGSSSSDVVCGGASRERFYYIPFIMATLLSLALVIAGYIAALLAPVMCCLPKEYKTRDGECCPMCHEGSVVRRDCTQQSGTRCSNCVNGTYMNQPNGLTNCFLCTSCDQGHGLFAQQECTATKDTICDVLSGYFCKHLMDGGGCSLAEKHSPCPPGHRIKEPGTSRTDTMCELCQPGHFSQDGLNCTVWTICSETQVKVEGSSSSDVVCGAASRERFFYIPFIMATLLSLALVITGKLSSRKTETSAQSHLPPSKRLTSLNDAVRHCRIQLFGPETT